MTDETTTPTTDIPETNETTEAQEEQHGTSAAMFYKIILSENENELAALEELREQQVGNPTAVAEIIGHIAAMKARAVHTATLCQSACEVARAQVTAIMAGMLAARNPAEQAVAPATHSAITRLRDALQGGAGMPPSAGGR